MSTAAQEIDIWPGNPNKMIFVKGGTFLMGDNFSDVENDEKPVHAVTLDDFYISKFAVSLAEYRHFCNETKRPIPLEPPWGWNEDHPIVNVSWFDAKAYCEWLSKPSGITYRLPHEAEWEYAARGGGKKQKYAGLDDDSALREYAWYFENSPTDAHPWGQTHPVGQKKPNDLLLHDMMGNCWEWCEDWYDEHYYSQSPDVNPRGPSQGVYRVRRGGAWNTATEALRCSFRLHKKPEIFGTGIGFRIIRVP